MPELDLTQLREVMAAFAPQGRSGLLPALHAAQALYGWISEPIAAEISRALECAAGRHPRRDRILFDVLQRADRPDDRARLHRSGLRHARRR